MGSAMSLGLTDRRRRHTLEEMQEIAAKRGGRCLSTEYVNSSTPLMWECAHGHQWKATPDNVMSKSSWCRFCSQKERPARRSMQDMQALARAQGGGASRRSTWACRCRWNGSARGATGGGRSRSRSGRVRGA